MNSIESDFNQGIDINKKMTEQERIGRQVEHILKKPDGKVKEKALTAFDDLIELQSAVMVLHSLSEATPYYERQEGVVLSLNIGTENKKLDRNYSRAYGKLLVSFRALNSLKNRKNFDNGNKETSSTDPKVTRESIVFLSDVRNKVVKNAGY